MKFIKSRKFVATVAGVVTVIANEAFGMKLNNDSVVSIVALIMTYVLGQSHVDSKNGVDK